MTNGARTAERATSRAASIGWGFLGAGFDPLQHNLATCSRPNLWTRWFNDAEEPFETIWTHGIWPCIRDCDFHRSNHGARSDEDNIDRSPHMRSSMSAELFRTYCKEAGLEVIRQNILDWGDEPELDCVTLFRLPAAVPGLAARGELGAARKPGAARPGAARDEELTYTLQPQGRPARQQGPSANPRMAHEGARRSEVRGMGETGLEQENLRLKELLADALLENDALRRRLGESS